MVGITQNVLFNYWQKKTLCQAHKFSLSDPMPASIGRKGGGKLDLWILGKEWNIAVMGCSTEINSACFW